MARANLGVLKGFKYYAPLNNTGFASPQPFFVASGYGTAIYPGDPLASVNDGTVAVTAAGTGAGSHAICSSIRQATVAGEVKRHGLKYLPASTTYSTGGESIVMGIPVQGNLFECVVTGTNASIAVARSAKFNNADHLLGTADTGLGLSGAAIDMSTAATTATLQWRIHRWMEELPSNDSTQENWIVLVYANVLNAVGGLPAVLGV